MHWVDVVVERWCWNPSFPKLNKVFYQVCCSRKLKTVVKRIGEGFSSFCITCLQAIKFFDLSLFWWFFFPEINNLPRRISLSVIRLPIKSKLPSNIGTMNREGTRENRFWQPLHSTATKPASPRREPNLSLKIQNTSVCFFLAKIRFFYSSSVHFCPPIAFIYSEEFEYLKRGK